MNVSDGTLLLAIGACSITLLLGICWVALRLVRRDARRRASWIRFVARSRVLSDLSRLMWGPPKLTDQREKPLDPQSPA